MPLRRVVRRVLYADVNGWIRALETLDLTREHLAFGTERAAGKGDEDASIVAASAAAGG